MRDKAGKPKTPETKSDAWLANAEKLGLGKSTVKVVDITGKS